MDLEAHLATLMPQVVLNTKFHEDIDGFNRVYLCNFVDILSSTVSVLQTLPNTFANVAKAQR